MTSLDPFESRLREAWPPPTWEDLTVLLAVSGGRDSVALLRGLTSAARVSAGSIVAAHFNHGTRRRQSDEDQAFVVELCHRLDVPCTTGQAPKSLGRGVESAMREARYNFLLKTAEDLGARYVVTAHTADDQAETILFRVVRGTGLSGLAGIPRVRRLSRAVSLVRPMLSIRRDEVTEYLGRLGQPFREDASNHNLRHTRNRIRHELLPEIGAHYNKEIVDALLRLGQLAGEAQQVIAEVVEGLIDECVSSDGEGTVRIDCVRLAPRHAHLVRELCMRVWRQQDWPQQAMGYHQWEALCAMMRQENTTSRVEPITLPGRVLARRSDRFLILERPRR